MGWSSSRWLFGTQFGWCHAVGLAVERSERAARVSGRAAKPSPTTPPAGDAFEADFLFLPLKKQVKIYTKFNQNEVSKAY